MYIENQTVNARDYLKSMEHTEVLSDTGVNTNWIGKWVARTSRIGDFTIDGRFLAVANTSTVDRPAPTNVGIPFDIYTGTLSTHQESAKQVIFGQRYTVPEALQITGYRVDVIIDNHYDLYLVEDPNGVPVLTELMSFTASSTGWLDIDLRGSIVPSGVVFDVMCMVNEPASTPTVTVLNYDYNKPNNVDQTPATGTINHASKGTDTLYIHKTDDDGNDNSVFLDTLTVGDIISVDTMSWTIQSISDNAISKTVGISPAIQSVVAGVNAFSFETVVVTPITVGYELDYNVANTIKGLYIADGAYADIVPDDNQYGIDITIQQLSVSSDWDLIPL